MPAMANAGIHDAVGAPLDATTGKSVVAPEDAPRTDSSLGWHTIAGMTRS